MASKSNAARRISVTDSASCESCRSKHSITLQCVSNATVRQRTKSLSSIHWGRDGRCG